ncbi:MAG: c(7)-type cytochrome triheme domain-containing protein [Thermodesulfovibrionales bacterium]
MAALLFCLTLGIGAAWGFWNLPPDPAPDEYGNILINRISEKNGVNPVAFSHWIHRQKYTCRVCHFELEFGMGVNTTGITEEDNRKGKYCGACHNGKISFGHDEANCGKCHNGDKGYGKGNFSKLTGLPEAGFGNRIDWSSALAKGMISPVNSLSLPPSGSPYDKELLLEAEWSNIPPAVFSHSVHNQWLDCNNCHPDIFNIKKKTTKHFSMERILQGEFCGACHNNVAFPMRDCRRCHPGMKTSPY